MTSGFLIFKTNNAGSLTEKLRITNVGDVGIGTTNPGGQFELSLDEGRKPGGGFWTTTSDARLKTVHGNYTAGMDEIRQLQTVRFNYKNAGSRTFEPEVLATEFSGFLAQDVQKVFPGCVTTDEDGYLSLNVHDIFVASVNALQQLDAKNTELEKQNADFEKRLTDLERKIELLLSRDAAQR